MSLTGLDRFDTTLQKTNEILKEIEETCGWQNRRNQSYAALRAVLHTLRDRLTVEEASQFGSQLPILVRGIFYEGWKPAAVPKKLSKEEFLQEIRKEFTFAVDTDMETITSIVFTALKKHISAGEVKDIMLIFPKDLAQMLRPMIVGT